MVSYTKMGPSDGTTKVTYQFTPERASPYRRAGSPPYKHPQSLNDKLMASLGAPDMAIINLCLYTKLNCTAIDVRKNNKRVCNHNQQSHRFFMFKT